MIMNMIMIMVMGIDMVMVGIMIVIMMIMTMMIMIMKMMMITTGVYHYLLHPKLLERSSTGIRGLAQGPQDYIGG